MDKLVQAANRNNLDSSFTSFLPTSPLVVHSLPAEDLTLHRQQTVLSAILETAVDYTQAQTLLQQSSLAQSDWEVERWNPYMIETALAIAQKWRNGFD